MAAERFGIAFAIAMTVAGTRAAAQATEPDLQYELATGALYSDNVERTTGHEEGATMATAGIALRARRLDERLTYKADSDITFLRYLDADLPNQEIGKFDGLASYALVPDRVLWIAEDHFGQSRIDNLSPAAPENRQNVNWLGTGPELHFKPVGSLHAQVSARYAREDYEESPFDNDRSIGELRLIHQANERSSIGLGASTEHVEFADTDEALGDYDLNEALILYRATTARTGLRLAAGYAEIDRDELSQDDPVLRLEMRRLISSYSSVRLSLTQDYSTTTLRSLGNTVTSIPVATDYTLAQVDPRRVRMAGIEWIAQYPRTRLECGAQAGKEDDAGGTSPRNSLVALNCSVGRRVTPAAELMLFGGWVSDDVEDAGYDGNDTVIGASFAWTLGPRFATSLQVARIDESGFTENAAWLRLVYAPRGVVQRTFEDLAPVW